MRVAPRRLKYYAYDPSARPRKQRSPRPAAPAAPAQTILWFAPAARRAHSARAPPPKQTIVWSAPAARRAQNTSAPAHAPAAPPHAEGAPSARAHAPARPAHPCAARPCRAPACPAPPHAPAARTQAPACPSGAHPPHAQRAPACSAPPCIPHRQTNHSMVYSRGAALTDYRRATAQTNHTVVCPRGADSAKRAQRAGAPAVRTHDPACLSAPPPPFHTLACPSRARARPRAPSAPGGVQTADRLSLQDRQKLLPVFRRVKPILPLVLEFDLPDFACFPIARP